MDYDTTTAGPLHYYHMGIEYAYEATSFLLFLLFYLTFDFASEQQASLDYLGRLASASSEMYEWLTPVGGRSVWF